MESKKDISNTTNSLNHTHNDVSLSMFSDDKGFVHVYKKTERIVAAVYMITNFFSDNEPLKWKLRNGGAELLSDILLLRQTSVNDGLLNKEKVFNNISGILSLFTVAHYAGIVSPMNHQVLQTEFEKLVQSITAYGNDISQKAIYLDKDFFKDQNEDVVNSIQGPSMSHYKGHVSTSDNFKKTESNSSGNQSTEDKGHSKKSNSNNTPTETSNQNEISAKKSGNVSEALKDIYNVKTPSDIKKTSRRSLIINTIQKKGSVMIKDLTPVIKGCSEKTIQRELATLVDKGIVNKEGERRWSVYSMA